MGRFCLFRHRSCDPNIYTVLATTICLAYGVFLYAYGYGFVAQYPDMWVHVGVCRAESIRSSKFRQVICRLGDPYQVPPIGAIAMGGCLLLNLLTVICYAVIGLALKCKYCEPRQLAACASDPGSISSTVGQQPKPRRQQHAPRLQITRGHITQRALRVGGERRGETRPDGCFRLRHTDGHHRWELPHRVRNGHQRSYSLRVQVQFLPSSIPIRLSFPIFVIPAPSTALNTVRSGLGP